MERKSEGTPHELSKLEVRETFIRWIWDNIETWKTEPSAEAALQGAFGSLLGALDGANMGLPAFMLVPDPCEGDDEHYRSEGENWFPYTDEETKKKLCDIAGSLRDEFYAVGDKLGRFG